MKCLSMIIVSVILSSLFIGCTHDDGSGGGLVGIDELEDTASFIIKFLPNEESDWTILSCITSSDIVELYYDGEYEYRVMLDGEDISQYKWHENCRLVEYMLPDYMLPGEHHTVKLSLTLSENGQPTYARTVNGDIVICNKAFWNVPERFDTFDDEVTFYWTLTENNQRQYAYALSYLNDGSDYEEFYEELSVMASQYTFPADCVGSFGLPKDSEEVHYSCVVYTMNFSYGDGCLIVSSNAGFCSNSNSSLDKDVVYRQIWSEAEYLLQID